MGMHRNMPSPATARVPLSTIWRFPLRSAQRRRDLFVGGILLLFVPFVGWMLNLGHRWRVMERLYHDTPPWFRGFRPLGGTFMRGIGVAALGVAYVGPGLLVASVALRTSNADAALVFVFVGSLAAAYGFYAFPVAICRFAQGGGRDLRWFARHPVAFHEAVALGTPFLWMWAVTWATIAASVTPAFLALLAHQATGDIEWWLLAIPSAFLSPWAWSALGFAFGTLLVPATIDRERIAA